MNRLLVKERESKVYNFKLNLLSTSNLREILLHLRKEEKSETALACKSWRKALIPLIWEYFSRTDLSIELELFVIAGPRPGLSADRFRRRYQKLLKKYGRYIKYYEDCHLECRLNKQILPNLISLETDIRFVDLLKDFHHLIDGFNIYSYPLALDLSESAGVSFTKHLIKNVKKLNMCINEQELSMLLKLVSSSLSFLVLSYNDNIADYPKENLSVLKNLKYLEVSDSTYLKVDKLDTFLYSFPQLISLSLSHHKGRLVKRTKLNMNNFPNLRRLILNDYKSIELYGLSNITKLGLLYCNLNGLGLSHQSFPNLKIIFLITYAACFLRSKMLYSIFKLTQLTSLKIIYQNPIKNPFTLLEEIYPKSTSNLFSLRLDGFIIGDSFFKYIFQSCKHLDILQLADCKFIEEDIERYLNSNSITISKLTQMELNPSPKNKKIVKQLNKLCPKLQVLKLNETEFAEYNLNYISRSYFKKTKPFRYRVPDYKLFLF